MRVEDFVVITKSVKKSLIETAYFNFKAKKDSEKNVWILYTTLGVCKHCGNVKDVEGVIVHFDKPQTSLTIFEAGLLFALFVEKKLPFDYAQYHKCVAGKEFVENITLVEEMKRD